MQKHTSPSSEGKNDQSSSDDSEVQSQASSIDSEKDDASSFMDESNESDQSEIPEDDIKIQKVEDKSTGTKMTEFSITLPDRLTSYENFVWLIEPLIEKIEDYLGNNGEVSKEAVNTGRPSDIEPDKKFEPMNAVHFTGAILQSVLEIHQDPSSLIFRLEEPRSKTKAAKMKELVLKPILEKSNSKAKHAKMLSQEFVITCQEDFDPFVEFDETEVLSEVVKIIESYENIFKENELENRETYFNVTDGLDEILNPKKLKSAQKKKGKLSAAEKEAAAIIKAKAEFLLRDAREAAADQTPQKGHSAPKKGRKPSKEISKELTALFGGEIEITRCNPAEMGRVPSAKEKELRELLVSQFNSPSGEDFLMKLQTLLMEMSSTRISLYTAVLLSVVFYQSAKAIDNVTPADMSSFIKIANFIPFPTTPALRALNCGHLVSQCIDLLMSVELDNCMPRSTYFPAVHEFDHENYYMNVISANLCPKFLDLYLMPEIKVTTPSSARLSLYENQLSLLNKIFDFFANQSDEAGKDNGLTAKTVQKMLDEIKRVPGIKEYAECEYLFEIHEKLVKGDPVTLEKVEKKPEILETLKKGGKASVRKEVLDYGTGRSRASENIRMIEERPTRVINFEDMEEEDNDDDEDYTQVRKLRRRRSSMKEEKKSEEKDTKPRTRGRKKAIKAESPEKDDKMDIEVEKPQEQMKIEGEKEIPSTEKPKKKRGRKPNSAKKQITPEKAPDSKMIDENNEADAEQNKDTEDYKVFDFDIDETKLDLSKKDLKARKIEKEHAKNMKAILRRSTLAGAKAEVAPIQTTTNSNLKKKRDKLNERIQKTEEWLKEYHQKVVIEGKSIDQIQDLIEEIMEMHIRVVEMEHLMEKQRLFLLWRVKFDALLKKYKKRKRKNESGQLILLSFEELEVILNEADVLKITNLNDEPRFEELRAKYKKIQAIKQAVDAGSSDLNALRKANKELSDTNISYPALAEVIQEKIEINERIILFLETNVSVDTLDELIQNLRDKEHLLDPVLWKKLEEKHEEGNRYKNIVETLEIPRATYEHEHVSLINAAVTTIRNLKIEIPNQRPLNSIVLSFKWLLELQRFLRKCNEMVPETEEGAEVEANSMETEVNLAEQFDPEETVRYCSEWLTTFSTESADEKTTIRLKQLLKEARGFKIADQRIDALFKALSMKVCGNERGIFEEPKLAATGEQTDKIEIEDDLHMILESEEASENYKNWNDLYIQVTSTDLEAFLRNNAEVSLRDSALKSYLVGLKRNLETLINEYETNLKQFITLEEKVSSLKKYKGWLEWLFTAEEYLKQMDDKMWIPFEELRDLHFLAKKSETPRPWTLNKKVEEKYTQAESLLTEYKTRFQETPKQEESSASPSKGSIQQRIDMKKPTVSEAKRLKANLRKKIPFINCEQEIVHLDTMIDDQARWKLRADEFMNNNCPRVLIAAVNSSESLDDFEAIQSQFNQLEEDYLNSRLRDESNEKMLVGIECLFKSYILLKNLSQESNLEEWEKIVKYIEDNSGFVDIAEEKALLKALKDPIVSVKEQHNFVKNLKSLTQRPAEPLTLSELKSFLAELKKNSIKLPDDERFIEDLIQKIEDLTAHSRKICDISSKDPLIEFTKAFDEIKRLPISLPEEEKQLEEAINFANKIATFIRKFSNIDLHSTEKILNEYKTCPVSIAEAEKLSEKFERSKTMYEKVKFKLNDVEEAKGFDYDQVKEIVDNINDVAFDFDGNLTHIKAQVYSLYVKQLQKLAGAQDNAPNNNKATSENDQDAQEQKPTLLSSQTLKSLAKEGRDLKNALVEQQKDTTVLNQALFWIDNICRRLDAKLLEINAVSSLEVLDRMPKLLLGFVDLTQNFNDKKAALSGAQVHKSEETAGIFSQLPKVSPGKAKKTQKQLKDFFRDKKEDQGKEKKEGSQREASEDKLSSQLTTIQKEMEKNEKQIMENVESKSLASKLQEKIKESPGSPKKRGRKKKNKENADEEPQKHRRKAKPTTTNDDQDIELPTEELSKIDPKRSKAVSMIREILLNNNADLSFDAEKSITVAHSIVAAFPVLDESKEKLMKFAAFFKSVLRLPNVYRKLLEKNFPSKLLSKLYAKSATELAQLDKKLGESKSSKFEKVIKPEMETETYEGEAIKKKLKPQSSQPVNMIKEETNDLLSLEESLRLPPETSWNQGSLLEAKERRENSRDALLGPLSTNLPRAMRPVSMPVEEEEIGFPQSRNQYHQSSYNRERPYGAGPNRSSQGHSYHKMEEEGPRGSYGQKNLAKGTQEEILKIFDGRLKETSEENALRIGLYTCDSMQTVRVFPEIGSDTNNLIMIEGKMSFPNFESYINKWIGTRDEDKGEIISGWVESSNTMHQDACERISNMFLKTMKVGVTKYSHGSAKIFFMHESQFLPEWVEKFNFDRKKIHKNSYSSLLVIIMFQPSKFPFDLSTLRRIEPEILIPYREKNEETNMESGGSTPEIEPYSQSLPHADEEEEVNPKSQQTFSFNLGAKKTPGRDAPQMAYEEKPNQYKKEPNDDMELEKEKDESVDEKEVSFDTKRLLNQPLARVTEDENSGKMRGDSQAKVMKQEEEAKKSVKKSFHIKPQFDDASLIDSRRLIPQNIQARNEPYGKPKGQFEDQRRPQALGYAEGPSHRPRNYGNEPDNMEGQTNKRSNFNEFLKSVQDRLFPGSKRVAEQTNFTRNYNIEKRAHGGDDADDHYSGPETPEPESRQYITPKPQMQSKFPQRPQYQGHSPTTAFPRNDRIPATRFSGENIREPVQRGGYNYNKSPNYHQSPYAGRAQAPKDQDDDEQSETNVKAPTRFQPSQNRWKPQSTFKGDYRGGKYDDDDQAEDDDEVEEVVTQEEMAIFGNKPGKYQRDFTSSQQTNKTSYQRPPSNMERSSVEKTKTSFNYSNSNEGVNLQSYRYSASQRTDNFAQRSFDNRKFASSQVNPAPTSNKGQQFASKPYSGGSYRQTSYQQEDDSIDLGYDHQNEGAKKTPYQQSDSGAKGWASKRDNYPSRKNFEPARQFMGSNFK